MEVSEKKSKVILVDFGVFVFRAIYAWRRNHSIPPTYTAMNMLISCLSRIGLSREDMVIIAVDGRHSWRKEVDPEYKANRKELRDKTPDIDWDAQFESFRRLVENIDVATPFWPIQIERLEADDIIAYAVRFFSDRECVILSCDADYEQLTAFSNVKILSDRTKKYKIVKNPYKVLANKIRKEASDNLTSEIKSEEDYKRREKIVSLLELPDFVEDLTRVELEAIVNTPKNFDLNELQFDAIRNRFDDIYKPDKIVTIEDSLKKKRKRKIRRKKNGGDSKDDSK